MCFPPFVFVLVGAKFSFRFFVGVRLRILDRNREIGLLVDKVKGISLRVDVFLLGGDH